jgi:hypothetical protein
MKSIFDDPGNRKALGFNDIKTLYQVSIPASCEITTSDKEKYHTLKSLLVRNNITFKTSEDDKR